MSYEGLATDNYKNLVKAIAAFAQEKNPALTKPENKKILDGIIASSLKFMYKAGKREGFSDEKVHDFHIMRELAQSVAISAGISSTLEKSPDLVKKFNNLIDELCEEFKKDPEFKKKFDDILKSDLSADIKMKKMDDLLQDKFKDNPEKLGNLKKNMKELMSELLKAAQKSLDPEKNHLKQDISMPDAYQNLFGLISSSQAGGYQIPILQFIGNGFGFNDWNPYDGNSPIDYMNSLKDTQFGDSLGLNAGTASNYFSIPETAIDQFSQALEKFGLAMPSSAPTLTKQR